MPQQVWHLASPHFRGQRPVGRGWGRGSADTSPPAQVRAHRPPPGRLAPRSREPAQEAGFVAAGHKGAVLTFRSGALSYHEGDRVEAK